MRMGRQYCDHHWGDLGAQDALRVHWHQELNRSLPSDLESKCETVSCEPDNESLGFPNTLKMDYHTINAHAFSSKIFGMTSHL